MRNSRHIGWMNRALALLAVVLLSLSGLGCDEPVVQDELLDQDSRVVADERDDEDLDGSPDEDIEQSVACLPTGAACEDTEGCCRGLCHQGVCVEPQCCLAAGHPCENDAMCCSQSCDAEAGKCRPYKPQGACNASEECSSGLCDLREGRCVSCLEDFHRCEHDEECCGGRCVSVYSSSYYPAQMVSICVSCTLPGEACLDDSECCGAMPCNSEGLCGCEGDWGDKCPHGNECCAGNCIEGDCIYPLGITGEPCQWDEECVSFRCTNGACVFGQEEYWFYSEVCNEVGRCASCADIRPSDESGTCDPYDMDTGEYYSATCDLHDGRCWIEHHDGSPCTRDGECQSHLCDPVTELCASCRAVANDCSSDEDCCSSLCDGVTGRCVGCLPSTRPCESDLVCCSGMCDPVLGVCAGACEDRG